MAIIPIAIPATGMAIITVADLFTMIIPGVLLLTVMYAEVLAIRILHLLVTLVITKELVLAEPVNNF
jgi:hypothetical protein